MGVERFIGERRGAWDELSSGVELLHRKGARRVDGESIRRLLMLYRQASADLAYLRSEGADPELIRKMNRLVTRAHGLIYRSGPRSWGGVLRFFVSGYPRLFRETVRFTVASFLLCAVVYAMAYQAVQDDPLLVADILGGAMDAEVIGARTESDIRERFLTGRATMGGGLMSSLITQNNIRVALMAFAFGMTLGIGTVYVLAFNAAMLGGIAGAFARSGIESVFWSTVLPHGALELTAIVVAGGSGLMLGWSVWSPGDRTRRRAVWEEGRRAVLLAVGLIPAFIVAGVIEGCITGHPTMPSGVKLAIGLGALGLFLLYVALGGRRVALRLTGEEAVRAGIAS